MTEAAGFDAAADAQKLREAMKGAGEFPAAALSFMGHILLKLSGLYFKEGLMEKEKKMFLPSS